MISLAWAFGWQSRGLDLSTWQNGVQATLKNCLPVRQGMPGMHLLGLRMQLGRA